MRHDKAKSERKIAPLKQKSKAKQARQRETILKQTIARLEADLDNKISDEMRSLHLEKELNESRL